MRAMLRSLLFGSALLVSPLFAELTSAQRVADFEMFWQTYKDAYVFFDLKKGDHGVDWDALKAPFIERVKKAGSDLELYAAVTEAQALLRDGHCYNASFSKIRETERIYFQRIALALGEGNKVLVSKVVPGSVFDKAGVKVGDELVQFDGKTIRELAKEARKLQSASSESQFWNSFVNQLYIHNPLKGKPAGDSATIVFRSGDEKTVSVNAPWESVAPTGSPNKLARSIATVQLDEATQIKIAGPLPIDVRIFKDLNIGYVMIETWMKTEDPIQQFEKVADAIKDTEGLIIDLRGNGGGVGPWGILFTNYFIASGSEKSPNDSWMDRKLSKTFFKASYSQLDDASIDELFSSPETMQMVFEKAFGLKMSIEDVNKHFVNGKFEPFYLKLLLNQRKNKIAPYTKPIYALTNGGCYSTTDIFLTIMSEFKRIKTVGTPNGAGSGSPIPFVLPNSKLQVYVPHARAYPPFGRMIEGRPLTPDILVSPTAEDLKTGRDTVLNEGVKALLKEMNPMARSGVPMELNLTMPESVYNTTQTKEIDWGNIPMPDWAVEATWKESLRQELELGK